MSDPAGGPTPSNLDQPLIPLKPPKDIAVPELIFPAATNPTEGKKYTAILYATFDALANLLRFLTTGTLKILNDSLEYLSQQESAIAAKLNALAPDAKKPKVQAEITRLKNLQQQLQIQIETVQSTQNSITSGCATLGSNLNSINSNVQQAMAGVLQAMG